MGDNVESDRLGKRTALTNGDNISVLDSKSWRAVSGDVLVSFLVTTVLSDVVQVVSSDNDGSLHLGGHDLSLEDSSTDGDTSSEGALLVDIRSLNGGIGGLDTETNVLDEAHGLGARRLDSTLSCYKDGILLLVGLFVLIALDVFLGDASHDNKLMVGRKKENMSKLERNNLGSEEWTSVWDRRTRGSWQQHGSNISKREIIHQF
mmetsp:Transcript_19250/g.47603  ORF Transcript_19250/g.47603 Transcript_19250/m.47603 type:complete len:205 (+) Transcript_19250:105-719(+)